MKNRILLTIFFFGTIFSVFAQHSFRNAVLLTHSSGSRLYDYEAYMQVDSGDITSVPIEMDLYDSAHNYTGADQVQMVKRWFPDPLGTDWINWLECFRGNIAGDNNNVWAKTDTFDVIIIKGGIQTCNMTGYGSPSDTSGGAVTNKTVETYKWIWRELVELMESRPDKFWIIMTGSASGDENNTPTGAQLAHEFAIWAKDTLANGNDPVYGEFPPNVYVFDYFHYLADNEYYLKDEYESGYQSGLQDDHPNATACNDIAPIFVQEVFDAAITYETIIPVEMTLFSASIVTSGVELNWSTATELNNAGFEIQKQIYNGDFITIGFVNGQGTSTQINEYSFIDDKVNPGKNVYRLKQIDFNGNYEHSNVVEIFFYLLNNYKLEQNYPNPFNPTTTISFNQQKAGYVKLTLFNLLGQELKSLINEYKEAGNYKIHFDADKLNSGMYIYKIEVNGFIQSRKMLLVK
jgi:hypothetical protein